jgi:hypothetical protein
MLKLINNDFLNTEKINIIENIYNKLNNLTNKSKIKLLNNIIEKLYYKIDDEHFFDTCVLITKKIGKTHDFLEKCHAKFLSEDFDEKLEESSVKFVNWLMN